MTKVVTKCKGYFSQVRRNWSGCSMRLAQRLVRLFILIMNVMWIAFRNHNAFSMLTVHLSCHCVKSHVYGCRYSRNWTRILQKYDSIWKYSGTKHSVCNGVYTSVFGLFFPFREFPELDTSRMHDVHIPCPVVSWPSSRRS